MANEISSSVKIHNLELEKFVLGATLLKDGEIIPDIAAILDTDDFYRPEHRLIFDAVKQIYADKKPVTIATLFENLRQNTDFQGKSLLDSIGIDYVLSITEVAHTTAYAVPYAQEIKNKSNLRKLAYQAENILADCQQGLKSPLDIIADTNNVFRQLDGGKNSAFFDVATYIESEFIKQAEKQSQFADRKSGFYDLDKFQQWKSGLYILGATPACGKTTFAWQLLEQFAESGENCIFCSYEMDLQALTAKTIARRLYSLYDLPALDQAKPLTSTQIQLGKVSNNFSVMAKTLFEKKLNFTAKKFTDENVDKLLAILRQQIKELERPPIICIDYLQRLIPRDKAADTRALIDDALYKLKDFANETNALILAISSFNRANYNQYPSFENFKESGGVEYTADVVLAMQMYKATKTSNRQEIEKAKNQQPREISLHCLKNRHGNNYTTFFKYFSAYDYFEPCQEFEFKTETSPADVGDEGLKKAK